jgi:flagellar FliL protein
MAKEPKSGGGEKKSGGGFVGVLVATLLAVAGGGGFGWHLSGMLKEREPEPAKKEAAGGHSGGPHKKDEKPAEEPAATMLVEMKPIIANLADPKTAWVRIEAALVVTRDLESVQELTGKIAEDITAYLKNTTMAQFEGASGFQSLREDLNERARLRGGKDVKEVVVHGMVVE